MKPNIINGFNFDTLPITITYVGKVEDKEWPHFLWNVVIKHKDGFWTVPYKCGIGWVEKNNKPKPPTNADIMYSLLSDAWAADESFNSWCEEFGYDPDSMRAFKTYQTCCEEGVNLRKTFTREQIEEMRKALEDY